MKNKDINYQLKNEKIKIFKNLIKITNKNKNNYEKE